jgi:5-hydroxyisourate hydrolase
MSISTHVLDATSGHPAARLQLTLSRLAAGRLDREAWHELSRRATDADGRVSDLAGDVEAGVYRIVFETEAYLQVETFYPEVVLVFRITDPAAHYHVPLLLSPFAYSTSRGS